MKHKFQYGSLQAKSVSAPSQEPHAKARPNHFIEGMPKRLRLLCTPHVKRESAREHMGMVAVRVELQSQKLKVEASSKVWVTLFELR